MLQTKVAEKIKTHVLFSINLFFFENHVVYEIMWENTVERGRPQMTIWRIRIARWITEATNTHIQHVIRILLGHITLPIYFHKIQSSSRNTLHDVGRFYVISEYWFLIHMNFPDDDRNRKKEPRRKGYVNNTLF